VHSHIQQQEWPTRLNRHKKHTTLSHHVKGGFMLIVGIGGTMRPDSSTECALRLAVDAAAQATRAESLFFGSKMLCALPHYGTSALGPEARAYIDAVRRADGIVIASPGYHGAISGLVKNALDYIEETAKDQRPYLTKVPVGLIATAYGWQAAVTTLASLRTIIHALRGWPTPFGGAIRIAPDLFENGECRDGEVKRQLELVGRQVAEFVTMAPLGRSAPRDVSQGRAGSSALGANWHAGHDLQEHCA
jgi:FMN reductase